MIKYIFIDIDNTLLDFNICACDAMRDTFCDFGIEFKRDMFDIFLRINNGLWRDIEDGKLTREGLRLNRWNKVFAELGINGVDGVAFEDSFHDKLKVSSVPVNGALELVKYLSSKYVLCSTSNGPFEQQRYRLEKAGMLKYIKYLFLSEKIGASKPTIEFFNYCFNALGNVNRDEVLLIGDSLTADIKGGADYGIDTIWFNHDDVEIPKKPLYKHIVYKLDDIKNIL